MTTINPKHWSRAYFSTDVKCDSVDNNMSESFNSLILEARHKPIFSMLEDIRIMCMEQIAAKRLLAMEWKGAYCRKILRKLAGRAKMSRYCHIIGNGKDGYEVRYKNEDRFVVQLELAKCSCRSWELTGVPCPHAISCIICEGKDPQEFIDDCYTVERYWKTYDNVMILMNGPSAWVPSISHKGNPAPERFTGNNAQFMTWASSPLRLGQVHAVEAIMACIEIENPSLSLVIPSFRSYSGDREINIGR
ncbi:hypothetical protein LINPERHAP1_LOCUS21217 [Linum perenne]